MTLCLLCAIPLVGAFVAAFARDRGREVAGLFALATLVVAIVAATQFDWGSGAGGMQETVTKTWISFLGVHFALGIDALGLLMVMLTTVLVPIVFAAAWKDHGSRWFAWALALEAFALVVFCATDVFLFYVVFEATLIPAYFMIGNHGIGAATPAEYGPVGRIKASAARSAIKFLMYQLGGGLVLLGGVIGLYVVSAKAGTPSYLISDLAQLHIGTVDARWIFVAFFVAFAVKAPLFPVHTWLADTTEFATPQTSVLLVCVLDKIGTFGMIRFCLGLFPEASRWATPVVIAIALISIVYGAFLAIGQDNLLRLIGLTSLSHFGLITLGIFAFTREGSSGAMLYMVNHGIATAAMFIAAAFLISRKGTASIGAMRGLEKRAPLLAGLFLVGGLATAGLPGLSQFVSEILVLISAFAYHWWVGAIAVTAVVLAAIYVLWAYQRLFTGPPDPVDDGVRDLTRWEVGVLAPLMVGLVVFGFYPKPLLDLANHATDVVLVKVAPFEALSPEMDQTIPPASAQAPTAGFIATPVQGAVE